MKLKHLLMVINTLFITSITEAATSYGPITGSKNFEDGDSVNSTTDYGISDTTRNGSGIQVTGSIKVNVTNPSTSTTNGVNLANGVTNNLAGSVIEANTTTPSSNDYGNPTLNGINVSGAGTVLNANGLQVTAKGTNNVTGLNLSTNSSTNLGTGSIINASSSSAITDDRTYGIRAQGASLTANNITINASSPKATAVTQAVGLAMMGSNVTLTGNNIINVTNGAGLSVALNSTFTTDQINITLNNLNRSSSGNVVAAVVGNNSIIDLGNNSSIQVAGDRSNGILLSNNTTLTANNLTIAVNSDGADAAGRILSSNGSGNNITINGATLSNTKGHGIDFFNLNNADSYLNLSNATVSSSGTTAGFIGNVKADLNNVVINNHNTLRYNTAALSTDNNAEVTANDVTINLEQRRAVAVSAVNGGKVTFTGNTMIDASKGIGALSADGEGAQGQGQIKTGQGGSKMVILGSLNATNNGLIDLTLNDGSYIQGTTTAQTGSINLAMTNSVWDMSDNSTVSDLKLNNSQVNFTKASFSQLQTNNLSGSGLFTMKVDIAGQKGDLLEVIGTTTGNHKITVTNNGSQNVDGEETLTIVKTADGGGNFSLTHAVELGGYTYNLSKTQNDPNNWELSTRKQLTSSATAAINFLNTGYLLNYIDNQTLLQRLGSLRNNYQANNDSNFWIRSFGGKLNSFSGSQLDGFDMAYWGTQAGIDKDIPLSQGRLVVGAMLGLTKGNPNYQAGNGDSKNYSAGLYASYLDDSGFYIDNLLKYNITHNHFSVTDTAGATVSGTGKTQGYSLSSEIGKRIWLTPKNNGFYIEPQAQLTYGYQNGDTVHASNGLKVNLSHYNTTLARTSLITGYQIEGENPINIYLKTGYIREMSGGTSYKLNNNKESHNFRGGWWDNGVGINANFYKNHNIYTDITYAKGNRFDQKQINLGYRYSF